ncbi:MAG: RNA methyltransferase, partial [Ruaniaceae bacterium]|nr:RNA methyltransferase [Ruaniaceae bacterium]
MTERPEMLANVHAERVKKVAALSGRSARSRHGQFLVEGPGAVHELVTYAPHLVRDLYLAPEFEADPAVQTARAHGLYVHLATREVLGAMSRDAQGILAVARTPTPLSLDVLDGARLAVLLPQASDPGNLGTLIRIADAAGADAVVVCSGSAEVTNPKVVRSTTG